MPTKITTIPTALLGADEALVQEGDILDADGPDSGRRVRLCTSVPDDDGMVLVQETYKVAPEVVGLHIRPATVVVEMTVEEAKAVVEFYRNAHRLDKATGPLPALDALSETVPQAIVK